MVTKDIIDWYLEVDKHTKRDKSRREKEKKPSTIYFSFQVIIEWWFKHVWFQYFDYSSTDIENRKFYLKILAAE